MLYHIHSTRVQREWSIQVVTVLNGSSAPEIQFCYFLFLERFCTKIILREDFFFSGSTTKPEHLCHQLQQSYYIFKHALMLALRSIHSRLSYFKWLHAPLFKSLTTSFISWSLLWEFQRNCSRNGVTVLSFVIKMLAAVAVALRRWSSSWTLVEFSFLQPSNTTHSDDCLPYL